MLNIITRINQFYIQIGPGHGFQPLILGRETAEPEQLIWLLDLVTERHRQYTSPRKAQLVTNLTAVYPKQYKVRESRGGLKPR